MITIFVRIEVIKVQCINSGISRKRTAKNRLNINWILSNYNDGREQKKTKGEAYCSECHMTVLPNPFPTGFPEFRKDLTLPCSFRSETRGTVRNARAGHDGQYWDFKMLL